jgi:ubiquinone/menaquinone biosynthesis C-methylase UbiE
MTDIKKQVQQTFGTHAENYVTSPTHARGKSLSQLLKAIPRQPGWKILDIATGGGHTALACAEEGAAVIASDLTLKMLQTARQFIHKQNQKVFFVQHDAEAVPFPADHFDLVTCRIAPHHFPDVPRFVHEAARVLKPGGGLGIVDIISPDKKKAADYCNAFEKLRDPSHVWAFRLRDWRAFFEEAGLEMTHTEAATSDQQLGVWAARVGCDDVTIHRLRAMLLQAPQVIKDWYNIKTSENTLADIPFSIQQAVMIARKRD